MSNCNLKLFPILRQMPGNVNEQTIVSAFNHNDAIFLRDGMSKRWYYNYWNGRICECLYFRICFWHLSRCVKSKSPKDNYKLKNRSDSNIIQSLANPGNRQLWQRCPRQSLGRSRRGLAGRRWREKASLTWSQSSESPVSRRKSQMTKGKRRAPRCTSWEQSSSQGDTWPKPNPRPESATNKHILFFKNEEEFRYLFMY